jgi:hypothetical protein
MICMLDFYKGVAREVRDLGSGGEPGAGSGGQARVQAAMGLSSKDPVKLPRAGFWDYFFAIVVLVGLVAIWIYLPILP